MEMRTFSEALFLPSPILNYEKSRELDSFAQTEWGISGITLMGLAAKSFLDAYRDFLNRRNSICILAGKGNNGGDGYALAYFLACEEIPFVLYEMIDSGHTEAAGHYRNLLIRVLESSPSQAKILPLSKFSIFDGSTYDVFVDCILGTGARKEASIELLSLKKSLAKLQSSKPTPILALDHPSFDSDLEYASLGEIGCFKWENLHFPRNQKRLVTIGFPILSFLKDRYSQEEVYYYPPPLDPSPCFQKTASHKYDAGSCVFLGGSEGMEGAILLSSAAFMGFGGGISKVFFHSKAGPNILLSRDASFMSSVWEDHSPQDPFFEKASLLIWGPGTLPYKDFSTYSSWIQSWLGELESRYSVWDGGAIPSYGDWDLSSFHERILLTPHMGEFKRLTGLSQTPGIQESADLVRRFCLENRTNLFLKSHPCIFGSYQGTLYIWDFENPKLATMGTGDLLSGILGILIAKGFSMEYAVYIALSLFSRVTEMEMISPTAWEIFTFLKEYLHSKIRS